jgi:hypothetical protein
MATMMPATHQNCAASPPGKCGSGTFMPHIPLRTVSGRKMVDITVSTFIDLVEAVGDAGQVHFQDAGDAILKEDGFIGQPHDVVVDVADAIRHLVGNGGELTPRQPPEHVALRHQHTPHLRQLVAKFQHRAAPADCGL